MYNSQRGPNISITLASKILRQIYNNKNARELVVVQTFVVLQHVVALGDALLIPALMIVSDGGLPLLAVGVVIADGVPRFFQLSVVAARPAAGLEKLDNSEPIAQFTA